MKKRKKPKRLTKPRNNRSSKTKATPAVKQPKPAIKVATGVRAKAARRTAEGKFTKVVFNQIGGKECPRFAAMTWKERDAFMTKPENAVVRERYEKHMASVDSKAGSLSSHSVRWWRRPVPSQLWRHRANRF